MIKINPKICNSFLGMQSMKSSCAYSICQNSSTDYDTCPKCNSTRYCSQNCLRKDWTASHQFTCSQHKTAIQDYIEDRETKILGKGSYGEVKLVKNPTSGQYFALKQINKERLKSDSSLLVMLREINIHKALKHPNVIQLFQHFEDDKNVYILLEYAPNGSLFKLIKKRQGLSEEIAWHYYTQTCVGLKYLHDNHIIHRDLKPENLLLDQYGNVKICDFGWCVQSTEQRQTFCGTLDYMAPEMILEKGHSFELDMWAIGVLLYELLHGYPPFRAVRDTDKCQQILLPKLTFDPKISPEAADLIKNLLRTNPEERLQLNEVLAHPWIARYAPSINTNVNTKAIHPEYGLGVITNIEGLLCTIFYHDKNFTQYLAVPDIPYILEIQPNDQKETLLQEIESLKSIDSEASSLTREKRLLHRIHKWCKAPVKRKNKFERKLRKSINLKEKNFKIALKLELERFSGESRSEMRSSNQISDGSSVIDIKALKFVDLREQKSSTSNNCDGKTTEMTGDQSQKAYQNDKEIKEFNQSLEQQRERECRDFKRFLKTNSIGCQTRDSKGKTPNQQKSGITHWFTAIFGCVERRRTRE
ncbi:unnamed protein product [Blepharisma stoltei]|uniref:Aurora kinase n=1 Tax=Blepharisma stoltei TaxID=1481888 RepID=A0AAU9J4A2_9CILI|nr:unnamed protein product [Blepharisma stoltei]